MVDELPRPVVLAAFANDAAHPLAHLEAEFKSLRDVLEGAAEKARCEPVLEPFATAGDVLDAFQDPRYRGRIAVFHYAGHADSYALLLQAAGGRVSPAYGRDLAGFMAQQRGLALVFLNACSTEAQVQDLLQAGVGAVIATARDIRDDVAADLASRFYRALAGDRELRCAFDEAASATAVAFGGRGRLRHGRPGMGARGEERWPWKLHTRPGDRDMEGWTLRIAARRLHPLLQDEIALQAGEPRTVLIPAGAFLMGSKPGSGAPAGETPPHPVELPDYRIGAYPVRNDQYTAFVRECREHPVPPRWFNRAPPGPADHPVVNVRWQDAVAYCEWLSQKTGWPYRLPSEAEWEKAASWSAEGGPRRRYPWGPTWLDGRCSAGARGAAAVTAHPSGASAYGVEDLVGNVQQWTRSLWGSRVGQPDYGYPYDPADGREVSDPARLPPQARLALRGGWYESGRAGLRCAARGSDAPDSRVCWRGFRVALAIQQEG